jgi:hypothetical protein
MKVFDPFQINFWTGWEIGYNLNLAHVDIQFSQHLISLHFCFCVCTRWILSLWPCSIVWILVLSYLWPWSFGPDFFAIQGHLPSIWILGFFSISVLDVIGIFMVMALNLRLFWVIWPFWEHYFCWSMNMGGFSIS